MNCKSQAAGDPRWGGACARRVAALTGPRYCGKAELAEPAPGAKQAEGAALLGGCLLADIALLPPALQCTPVSRQGAGACCDPCVFSRGILVGLMKTPSTGGAARLNASEAGWCPRTATAGMRGCTGGGA